MSDEAALVPVIRRRVAKGTTIHADEAAAYDILHAHHKMKRINHQEAYSLKGACTNQAESFFTRLRRAEIGIHHHVSGKYLQGYATEMAWREDHRRQGNGSLMNQVATLAMQHGMSIEWRGYGRKAQKTAH